jgi:hypothetical protein
MLSINYLFKGEQELNEGIIRGLASEFQDFIDDFQAIGDLFHTGRENILPRIQSRLAKLKKFLKNVEFTNKPGSSNALLKFRQGFARWRFFYFLNDKIYKGCLDYVKKTGKDPVGFVNFSMSDRIIPSMYNAKSSNDLIKLVELYEKRVKQVYNLVKNNPTVSGYRPFLRQGLYGLRDLAIAIRRLVSYHS